MGSDDPTKVGSSLARDSASVRWMFFSYDRRTVMFRPMAGEVLRMKASLYRLCASLTVAWLVAAPWPAAAVITNVDEADDVCAPTADPCNITERIETVPGAVLDFGTRHRLPEPLERCRSSGREATAFRCPGRTLYFSGSAKKATRCSSAGKR